MHFILKHYKKHSTSQSYREDPEKTRNCNEAPTVYLLLPVEETQLLLSSLAGARELQTFHLTDENRRADPKHWKNASNTREESISRRPQRFVPKSSTFHRSRSSRAQDKQPRTATAEKKGQPRRSIREPNGPPPTSQGEPKNRSSPGSTRRTKIHSTPTPAATASRGNDNRRRRMPTSSIRHRTESMSASPRHNQASPPVPDGKQTLDLHRLSPEKMPTPTPAQSPEKLRRRRTRGSDAEEATGKFILLDLYQQK